MYKFVKKIIELAEKSYVNDDIPVGAIIVKNDEIIGYGFNTRNAKKSVVGHAEISAIEMACGNIGDWRLDDCVMYVTLKPCMMCTGAIVECRLKKVFYLCDRTNVCFDCNDYVNASMIDDIESRDKYIKILQSFFENRRN